MNLEGRNEIRFNNSGGRCLLENWVEERATQHLETTDINKNEVNCAKLHQNGHNGLLTLDSDAKASKATTVRTSYAKPTFPQVANEGKRFQKMKSQIYDECVKEVSETFFPKPHESKMISVKKQDFDDNDFVFIPPKPEHPHSLYHERPTTFWSENLNKISGVSQARVPNAPFNKNTAFSKPLSEYTNEALPHDCEN